MLDLDPATVLEEGRHWTLALNRNQSRIGSLMLVLNRECTEVTRLTRAEWSSLQDEIARATEAVRALFAPEQFNYTFLMNSDAQVHMHVVPRYERPRRWGGRAFIDPDWGSIYGREQRNLSPDEITTLAQQLKSHLDAV